MNKPPCNFRPVIKEPFSSKPPKIFRSNAISDLDSGSAQWLYETVGIRTYIDLRESNEFSSSSVLHEYFLMKDVNEKKGFHDQAEEGVKKYGSRYNLRFFTNYYRFKIFAFRLRWNEMLWLILLFMHHLLYKDFEYQIYAARCYMKSRSIGNFYSRLLDDCQTAFRKIFFIMTEKTNFPILISCSFGKDRTGIVSAIAMQLVGYSNEMIIAEYSSSEKNLCSMKDQMVPFYFNRGTDERFCSSPPEAMEEMLHHLQSKYGNAKGFLHACGLTTEQIEQIKTNLTS